MTWKLYGFMLAVNNIISIENFMLGGFNRFRTYTSASQGKLKPSRRTPKRRPVILIDLRREAETAGREPRVERPSRAAAQLVFAEGLHDVKDERKLTLEDSCRACLF